MGETYGPSIGRAGDPAAGGSRPPAENDEGAAINNGCEKRRKVGPHEIGLYLKNY